MTSIPDPFSHYRPPIATSDQPLVATYDIYGLPNDDLVASFDDHALPLSDDLSAPSPHPTQDNTNLQQNCDDEHVDPADDILCHVPQSNFLDEHDNGEASEDNIPTAAERGNQQFGEICEETIAWNAGAALVQTNVDGVRAESPQHSSGENPGNVESAELSIVEKVDVANEVVEVIDLEHIPECPEEPMNCKSAENVPDEQWAEKEQEATIDSVDVERFDTGDDLFGVIPASAGLNVQDFSKEIRLEVEQVTSESSHEGGGLGRQILHISLCENANGKDGHKRAYDSEGSLGERGVSRDVVEDLRDGVDVEHGGNGRVEKGKSGGILRVTDELADDIIADSIAVANDILDDFGGLKSIERRDSQKGTGQGGNVCTAEERQYGATEVGEVQKEGAMRSAIDQRIEELIRTQEQREMEMLCEKAIEESMCGPAMADIPGEAVTKVPALLPRIPGPGKACKRGNGKKGRRVSKREMARVASAAEAAREQKIAMLAKTRQITDDELLKLKPKKQRRAARFDKPVPSRFCHVCSRTPKNVRLVVCCKIKEGTCRKVICEKCFEEYRYGDFEAALVTASSCWTCPHCVGMCPDRAQCRTYQRINDRLRVNRLKQDKPRGKGGKRGRRGSEGEDGEEGGRKRTKFLLPAVGGDDGDVGGEILPMLNILSPVLQMNEEEQEQVMVMTELSGEGGNVEDASTEADAFVDQLLFGESWGINDN